MISEPLNVEDAHSQIRRARSRPGRGHTTLWTSRLESDFFKIYPDGGIPPEARIQISPKGMTAVHVGRVHIRDVSSFCDTDYLTPHECVDFISEVRTHIEEMGGTMKGTGASTALSLWRDVFNRGPWRNTKIGTYDLDWYRRAFHGGRTQCYTPGVVFAPGHKPNRMIRKMNAPSYQLEPGKMLVRIDMTSAFPSMATRPLPYIWGKYSDELDLDTRCGIATCEVVIGDGIRILPIRTKVDGGEIRTFYPMPGARVRGTWTYPMLRELVSNGGRIVSVERARSFAVAYRPVADFMRCVFERQASMDAGNTKRAIKELGRRLYGKFGAGRWGYDLIPLEMALRPVLGPDGILKLPELPRALIGDRCFVSEQRADYPVTANPVWSAHIADRVSITLARVQKLLTDAGCPVLYVDTDSALFVCDKIQGKPNIPDAIRARMGHGLGEWRIDWEGNHACLLGPKAYKLENRRAKIAGVPRTVVDELLTNGHATYEQPRTILRPAKTLNFRLRQGIIETRGGD